jgi:hypothetical protein
LSSAVSIAERGETQDGGGIAAQHQIEEEIAKIKRYEDFTTIGMRQLPTVAVAIKQLEPSS